MQLAAPADRAGILGQLSRVRQIKEIPTRHRFGERRAIELGQVALGRVRVGGERRFDARAAARSAPGTAPIAPSARSGTGSRRPRLQLGRDGLASWESRP